MNIKPIKNDQAYYAALERLDEIFDAPIDSPEGDEAEVLSLLIENFEDKYYPIQAPDPIEAIKKKETHCGNDPDIHRHFETAF